MIMQHALVLPYEALSTIWFLTIKKTENYLTLNLEP